jgi:uncharacterized membrane protein
MIKCTAHARPIKARADPFSEAKLANKKKQKRREKEGSSDIKDVALAESRRADAATVAWTLAAMWTFFALAFRGLVVLMIDSAENAESIPKAAPYIPGLMLFTALVTGILVIGATPVVYWVRRTPPPWPITAGILVIGLTPLVLLYFNR